jgi:hypothetical protein
MGGSLPPEGKIILVCLTLVFLWVVLTSCTAVRLPDKQCEQLAMPPFPQKAAISIDGDSVSADPGGRTILEYYTAARRILK